MSKEITREELLDFYTNILGVKSKETLDYMVQHSRIEYVKKKTYLFQVGDYIPELYLIYQGFVYCVYQKTKTRRVIWSLGCFPAVPVLTNWDLKPFTAIRNTYCATETKFVVVDFDIMRNMIEKDPDLKQAYISLLQKAFIHQADVQMIRTIPSMERIRLFFAKYSHCARYMTNTEIAQFLDMSRSEYLKVLKQIQQNTKK